jgi:hypothetical protein
MGWIVQLRAENEINTYHPSAEMVIYRPFDNSGLQLSERAFVGALGPSMPTVVQCSNRSLALVV